MKGYTLGTASPCLTCTRVKNPGDCENKNCKVWQKWFLARWELLRRGAGQGAAPRQKIEGVSIGGRTYCHPDQIRKHLQEDPCESCKYPRELCSGPCRMRRTWEETKGDIPV